MPITYTNRKGQSYYLCQGTTKSGKPRYYFAREPQDTLAKTIPDGYEIQESVNGIVSLAKAHPKLLSDREINSVKTAIQAHPQARHYRIDVKSKQITIYRRVGPDLMELATKLATEFNMGRSERSDLRQRMADEEHFHSQFSPIMRFILVDAQQRLFRAQRMGLISSMADWIPIGSTNSIAELTSKLIPTLGTDRFFELF